MTIEEVRRKFKACRRDTLLSVIADLSDDSATRELLQASRDALVLLEMNAVADECEPLRKAIARAEPTP